MYYFYYGIWFGLKSRLSPKVILRIELCCLALVALGGVGMMILGFHMLGV